MIGPETPLSLWSEDQVYRWLWDEGVWTCGDDGGHALTTEEARVEVALQAEAMSVVVPGGASISQAWHRMDRLVPS